MRKKWLQGGIKEIEKKIIKIVIGETTILVANQGVKVFKFKKNKIEIKKKFGQYNRKLFRINNVDLVILDIKDDNYPDIFILY